MQKFERKSEKKTAQKMHQATAAGGSAINTSLFIQEKSKLMTIMKP